MTLSNDMKRDILKAASTIIKRMNGKGPQNIYIKTHPEEFHIVIQGFKSDFENYLIDRFGLEAEGVLRDFYHRDAENLHQEFLQLVGYEPPLILKQINLDFNSDVCQVVVKL